MSIHFYAAKIAIKTHIAKKNTVKKDVFRHTIVKLG